MSASPPRIAVVDYGAGNLRSVAKAIERSGACVEVSGDPLALDRADAVVLPGVGAFADAAASLRAKGLDRAVRAAIESGRPYLGLCLGLQLLFEESDEHGSTPGLALLPGRVRRFPAERSDGTRLLVPHIGWNEVHFRGGHPLLGALPERDFFYFVHAYRAEAAEPSQVVGTTDYGGPFAAAVAWRNVFAVQFHPEKSQAAGRRLLDAWVERVASCR
jgi:glutamine amidotransferase